MPVTYALPEPSTATPVALAMTLVLSSVPKLMTGSMINALLLSYAAI